MAEPGSGLGADAGGSLIVFAALMFVFVVVAMGLIQNSHDVSVAIGSYRGMDAVREAAGLTREPPPSTLGYLFVRADVTIVAVPTALFFLGVAMTLDGGGDGSLAGVGVADGRRCPAAIATVRSVVRLPPGYYRRRGSVSDVQSTAGTTGRERRHARPDDPMSD